MKHKTTKWIALIFLFVLSICLIGCASPAVQVAKAQPQEVQTGAEILDLRNCDSLDDLVTTLADEAGVQQHVSIAEQATLDETGISVDIPEDIADEVRTQIKEEYALEFEAMVEQVELEGLTIPGNMIHMYKILWMQRTYQSTLTFSIDDQPCTAFYTYTLEFPLLDSSTSMACTA